MFLIIKNTPNIKLKSQVLIIKNNIHRKSGAEIKMLKQTVKANER